MKTIKATFLIGILFLNHLISAAVPETVATINGKKLTLQEFNRRYKEQIKIFRFSPPSKRNILNDIIKFELAVQESKKMQIHLDPKVQERMNMVLVQALLESVLEPKVGSIEITDREVKSACQQSPELRTSHVFIQLSPSALKSSEKKAYKKARKALESIKSGKKFEAVVAEYSEGQAITTGGDLGFLIKDKMDPVYHDAASQLKLNQVSEIVRSQFGLHIIKLTGKKPCNDINFADWRRMLYNEKRLEIYEDFYNNLRKKAKVSVNEKLLRK